jgi:hypothetical protein
MNRCLIEIILLAFPVFSLSTNINPFFPRSKNDKKWELLWKDEFRSNESLRNWVIEEASPGHILSSRWKENVKIQNGKMLLLNYKENKGGKQWTTGCVYSKKKILYGYH